MKNIIPFISLLLALAGNNLCAQPHYRVIAFYNMTYDGSEFVKAADSVHLYFSGNYSYADAREMKGLDLPDYILLSASNELLQPPAYPDFYSAVSLPCDSSLKYGLNASGTDFTDLNNRTITTADANGNITELISRTKTAGTWENEAKESYTYNTAGQITEYVRQQWQSGDWHSINKEISVYDAAGRLVQFTKQIWAAGSWVNTVNHLYEYDDNGNCTAVILQQWNSGNWQNYSQTIITYNTNQPEHIVYSLWDGTTWKPADLLQISYNNNGDPLAILYQVWNAGNWVDNYRKTCTYSGNNKTTSISEVYNSGVWEKQFKTIYEYNNAGKLDTMTMQYWDNPNSDWENDVNVAVAYNTQGMKSTLTASSWNTGGYWDQGSRVKFFYEAYGDDNSGITNLSEEAILNIYPNPASGMLNIVIDWNRPQATTLTIYDMAGRVCTTRVLDKSLHTKTAIDITAVPAGNYYLKMATANGYLAKPFQIVR